MPFRPEIGETKLLIRKSIIALSACLLVAGAAKAADEDGKTTYTRMCSTCHQVTGAGLPGYYPPLAGSPVLTGEADGAISVVLKGRAGMPAWAQSLKDDQIAKILTYARSSWGNDAPAIDATKVAEIRKSVSGGSAPMVIGN
jgi:cytochrome c6